MLKRLSIQTEITEDHQLNIRLPDDVPTGPAEVVVVVHPTEHKPILTLGDLADSDFFGIWKGRDDIEDSAAFAERLREEAWRRSA